MAWTLDQCARIDMRDWTPLGLVDGCTNTAFWNAGRSLAVRVVVQSDRVYLNWGQTSEQVVRLDHTPCNFGGRRAWFLCPRCGRRIQVLYLFRGRWACWRCTPLLYGCQAEDALFRLMRRAQKIRRKLGGSPNLDRPFPHKPGKMRSQTYGRLRRLGESLEARVGDGLRAFGARQLAVIDRIRRKVLKGN